MMEKAIILSYSSKAIVVTGNTKPIKDRLKTTVELGFVPKYKEMTLKQTKEFIVISMTPEEGFDKIPDDDIPFSVRIITQRIKVMQLPISFTKKALFMGFVITNGNPGAMVTLLIDSLTKFEGKTVTGDMLSIELYPWGFYAQESFWEYVEEYLRPQKVKWGFIY